MTVIDLVNLVLGLWVVAQISLVALVGIAIYFVVKLVRKKFFRKTCEYQKKGKDGYIICSMKNGDYCSSSDCDILNQKNR